MPTPKDIASETPAQRKRRTARIAAALRKAFPEPKVELDFRNPFELIIATILAAQNTDVNVNKVTPELFRRYPTPEALTAAPLADIEPLIVTTGFYHTKARAIQGCARAIAERHGGKVPVEMDDLTALPGVGRKTANVVRGNAMGLPAIIVDTHVKRVSARLALVTATDPNKIEAELAALLPEPEWTHFTGAMILHGRRICTARAPKCPQCPLLPECPTGQDLMAAPPALSKKKAE